MESSVLEPKRDRILATEQMKRNISSLLNMTLGTHSVLAMKDMREARYKISMKRRKLNK